MGHGTSGMRLYRCDDCQHRKYVHWVELNRAGRLRCANCGSTRINPASQGAKRDRDVARRVVDVYGGGCGSTVKAH
jgi:DNA-directed RNA polymerase subunit RPC12/RpoP